MCFAALMGCSLLQLLQRLRIKLPLIDFIMLITAKLSWIHGPAAVMDSSPIGFLPRPVVLCRDLRLEFSEVCLTFISPPECDILNYRSPEQLGYGNGQSLMILVFSESELMPCFKNNLPNPSKVLAHVPPYLSAPPPACHQVPCPSHPIHRIVLDLGHPG